MKRRRVLYYLVTLFLSFAFQHAYSQSYTPISGVINDYTAVTQILSSDNNNVDSVAVASTAGFSVDDTVMLYCVKGGTIGTGPGAYPPGVEGYNPGEDNQQPRNTGRYAILLVTEVIGASNIVVFNTIVTPDIKPMEPGEVAQLIRVRSYRNANVEAAGVGADPWNPATGTGGVVALFVHGVLRLDGDIDVSGAGFNGAMGSTDAIYSAGCSSTDTMNFYEHFYLDGELWAGLKGEGITDTRFLYNRGKGSNINGGGGGNGLLSGGGGGSNRAAGASGGAESTACAPGVSVTGGGGGFDLSRSGWYYVNTPDTRNNRIFFGGGGGAGTRTVASTTTDGGNGGGIVVIVADTIVGNGGRIIADGGDVSEIALNGAGAGGGGGGCIILDVAGYRTLNLSAKGGDGGDSSGEDTTGMGGAGGGGIYWLAGDPNPPGVTGNLTAATNGIYIDAGYAPLESPGPAYQESDLVAPLRGFLFNPVPSEFTVCSDQDPDPITTSEPKGGDGTYTYQWLDSSKVQNSWEVISGAITKDYDPGVLSDTIYYRRVIYSLGLADTSFRIALNIHSAITGHAISGRDTVCYGNAPRLFGSSSTIGGGPTGGTFTYKWQHMPDGAGGFTDLTAASGEPTYQAGDLTTSSNFRRFAYAGVCIDTSNEERVLVLESLSGNAITPVNESIPFDTICINTTPDQISGPLPTDGDQADIRYQWLTSTDPGVMGSLLTGETAISYQSPSLDQTTYIRRIVLSGNDDACRDTSAYVEILNVPDITDNTISASQTVCQEDQADPLTGNPPGGGHLDIFTYTWIASTDQSSWAPATGGGANSVMTSFEPGEMNGDTTWYRRVVESGGQELVCKDTSSLIVINVLPSITNNVVTPIDDIKCQWDIAEAINGSLPGGGATVAGVDPTRVYRWEVAQIEGVPGSGDWNYPSTGALAPDYTDPNQLATDVDRWYKRIIISGPAGECFDTSNLVHLVVHSGITANAIDTIQAICFDDTKPLRHATLAGGEDTIAPVYTWRRWQADETAADAVPQGGSNQQEFEEPTPYSDPETLVYFYDRLVEIGACRDTSNFMQVTVMQLPGGELTDAGFDACEKDTVLRLDLNMDGLTAGHFRTPWEVYLTDGVHPAVIGPGSVDQDLDTMGIAMDTEGADHVRYTYKIESIRYYPEADGYACISSAAELLPSPVVANVSRRPEPQILVDGVARDSFKVCSTTATLVLEPDNGTMTAWSNPAGSVFFSPGSGQDEYQVSIPDNHDDFGVYRIFARSEAGDCAGEDFIDLHFFEQPEAAYAGEDTVLFLINSVQLKADPPTAGTGTWELVSGSGIIADEHDPHTYAYELGMGEENEFRWTVLNGVEEGICVSSNDVSIVLRNEVKKYNGFSPNGDMHNEYYIMQGLVYADAFSVTFLNALGGVVATITDEDVDAMEIDPSLISHGLSDDEMVIWDGRADNGRLVPSGTYYFVVTFKMHQRDYLTGDISGTDIYEFKDYVVVVRE